MNNKGTLSLELMITFIILIMICTTMISFSSNQLDVIGQTQNRREARLTATHITRLIDNVYINGEGYSQTYTLPERINDESYIVLINESGVYLNSHNQITYDTYAVNALSLNNHEKIILTSGNTYQFVNNNATVIIYKYN